MPALDDGDYRSAATALREAESIGLVCHVNPDGDALGSLLATMHGLAALGIATSASFPAPFAVGTSLRFLPGTDRLVPARDLPPCDVVVTFDCGDLTRLHELGPIARRAGTLIVLDHHVTNPGFGTINLVDPEAVATSVVVRRLLAALGAPVTPDVATCLYTALVADTGRFQWVRDPEVFRFAAELVDAGANPREVAGHLFENVPLARLELLSAVIGRAVYEPEYSMVWTFVTASDLSDRGLQHDDADDLVETVRTVQEADVACVVKQLDESRVKVSLRSRGAFDVASLSMSNGGGGHRYAAGFPATSIDGAMAAVRDGLRAQSEAAVTEQSAG